MSKNTDKYIGKTNIAKNGQLMTIIGYRNSRDIDIKFEDGEIVKIKNLSNFYTGSIANPKITKSRIGESIQSKCGMGVTVVAYRAYNDIDVLFEDGYMVRNVTYDSFKEDKLLNTKIALNSEQLKVLRKERLGQENIAKNGQKITIIEYRDSKSVDIKFEDGTIVKNKSYLNFLIGDINNSSISNRAKEYNGRWIDRTGETSTASNGMKMTIVKYNGYNDVDIQFEDGTIVKNKAYFNFKSGKIKNPNNCNKVSASDKIGMTNKNTTGLEMKIIAADSNTVTVEFEDKTIVKTTFNAFLTGQVRCKSELENKMKKEKLLKMHIGEKWKDKNNETITIVERIDTGIKSKYRVRYDDNTEVISSYTSIKNGLVSKRYASKIGLKSTNKNGETITIIEYRNSHDIDVQFEDGTIIKNRNISDFYNGLINKNYHRNKELKNICDRSNIDYLKMLRIRKRYKITVYEALIKLRPDCYINILGELVIPQEDGTNIYFK